MLFPAVHCPSIEGFLSDHMTYHLLSGRLGEFGSMVMLECLTGYYLGAGHRTFRCLANGTWEGSDDPATCKSKFCNKHQQISSFRCCFGITKVRWLCSNCQDCLLRPFDQLWFNWASGESAHVGTALTRALKNGP